ncbi:NAD(P)H-dependent oxidoreductase [Ovoidimarina sediminis]|uniref:NAD(P)H-dependent oxidoreductase n=1 Tax=Ovoidimarina sediminis TaxID=3079856 RepID=UPI0029129DD5|nr:NAD(P)H-dependent oxidoreductase [Rhodophyticola sp. MJ-SS7]MDU8942976.1 NAD(P)H-dependent oxidoreductase [Rhodophyticola sp. MJ-SS7]
MRALVVYCHPNPTSYTAAVRDRVIDRLEAVGAEIRLRDLYRDGFDPRLKPEELVSYADEACNTAGVAEHVADLRWCDTLIFIYPTWWYGLPAVLKGWLDRVLVPGVAFQMPDENGDIKPALTHITRLAVFTTCGASRWLTFLIGAPGRKTILRGVRLLCAKGCKTSFSAHYRMDSATPESLTAHLDRVGRAVDRWAVVPSHPEEATP